MEQIIINVENKSILPSLKRVLNSIEGITIVRHKKTKKCGLDEALEDVKEGRVTHYESAEAKLNDLVV